VNLLVLRSVCCATRQPVAGSVERLDDRVIAAIPGSPGLAQPAAIEDADLQDRLRPEDAAACLIVKVNAMFEPLSWLHSCD
jgi:hypothetical protein